MPPLRVVLDTNVLVSVLVLRSPSLSWLQSAWEGPDLTPVVSEATVAELVQVIHRPRFGLSPPEIAGLLESYLPQCEVIDVSEQPDVPDCRDPKDRPFLQLALLAGADALITGDYDLLTLDPEFSIPIITPSALQQALESVN